MNRNLFQSSLHGSAAKLLKLSLMAR